MTKKIRIILLEDHQLFRIGLCAALNRGSSKVEIVAQADSVASFLELIQSVEVDMALLDITLPDGSGIEVARILRQQYPTIKILILSADTTEETIAELITVGIEGFVSKSVPTADLCHAVEYIANGAHYFGPDIAKLIHNIELSHNKKKIEFTEREHQIVQLCANGYSAKEIANKLCVSICTVNTHKNNIFKKLGINNSVELVRYALKEGISKL